MFHFGGFPSLYYLFHIMICNSSLQWFPNSEISGSSLIYSSPKLIAVSHVLRRLPMPRHSPYALLRLNFSFCGISLYRALPIANNSFRLFSTVIFAFCAKCSFLPTFFGKTLLSWKIVGKELLLLRFRISPSTSVPQSRSSLPRSVSFFFSRR